MKINKKKAKKILRAIEAGARNNRTDKARIQDVHDTAVYLGASCGGDNVPGVRAKMGEAVTLESSPAEKVAEAERLLIKYGYDKKKARTMAEFTFGKKKT